MEHYNIWYDDYSGNYFVIDSFDQEIASFESREDAKSYIDYLTDWNK